MFNQHAAGSHRKRKVDAAPTLLPPEQPHGSLHPQSPAQHVIGNNFSCTPQDQDDTGVALEKKQSCGICLSRIETAGALGCAHSFCFDCIVHWSRVTNRCPLCRRRFSSISTSEMRLGPEGEAIEVAAQVLVEDRDAKVSPAVVVDDGVVDPLDEDSGSEDDDVDSGGEYDDDDSDDDDDDDAESDEDEWILNTPRPPPTARAGPVDEAEELRKRWARASVRRRFRCDQCEKAFKTSSDLKRHTLVHAQVRPFACDRCDKRFARRQDLQRHLVSHGVIALSSAATVVVVDPAAAEDDDQQRSPAPSTPSTPSAPSTPSTPSTPCAVVVDQATGQQRFACTYPGCGQTYSHRPNLTRHRKNAHKDALATSTTTAAASTTTSSTSSGDEARPSSASTGIVVQDATTGRFVCDFVGCGKSFTLRNNLSRHRNTHATASPSSSSSSPYGHARRSHQCLECDRSFAQSGDLKRHMSVHSGERPFQCHLCEQAFRQKAHLAAHLRSKAHTTTSPSSARERSS